MNQYLEMNMIQFGEQRNWSYIGQQERFTLFCLESARCYEKKRINVQQKNFLKKSRMAGNKEHNLGSKS